MQVQDLTIPSEAIDKVTVWACTAPRFNLGELTQQLQVARVPGDYVDIAGRKLLRQWKAKNKITFRRGYWQWSSK